jgi:hypothetical protein
MKAKPWQIVVMVVALVAVGVSAALMLSRSGPKIPSTVMLVDVSTGQLYEVNIKRYRLGLPAQDPEQKEYRLFAVRKTDEGWEVTGNGLGLLHTMKIDTGAVDTATGRVLKPSKDVREYVPPGAK